MVEPLSRRNFLSLGLAAPIGALAASHHWASTGLFPVSMDRCVLVTKERDGRFVARRFHAPEVSQDGTDFVCDRQSSTWHCRIAQGIEQPLVQDWWLIISRTEIGQPHLTVIQPPTAVPENAGLLAARITFRLHILKRRGHAQSFNNQQLVRRVNYQILRAMENMPV